MAGFTARSGDTAPGDLVRFLNGVYTELDGVVERHGLEKIKTTGDAYMVVSGVPQPLRDHAGAIANLALDFQKALESLVDPTTGRFQCASVSPPAPSWRVSLELESSSTMFGAIR